MSNRELDAEVATKVMGAILPQAWADPSVGPSHGDPGGYQIGVKPYSSDIAAAMEVVEKMGKQGFQASMVYGLKIETRVEDNDRAWWVQFADLSCVEFEAESDSLPEAICLAALKAIQATTSAEGGDNLTDPLAGSLQPEAEQQSRCCQAPIIFVHEGGPLCTKCRKWAVTEITNSNVG